MRAMAKDSSGMTADDLAALNAGMIFSSGALLPTQMREQLSTDALRFELPYFVIQGQHDWFTPTSPARSYFEKIVAPRKRMVVLEDAGHFALVTHTHEFITELRSMLAPLSATLVPQQAPRFMYIYRDSLKRGVDSAYRAIENDAAQICADLRCPNPYLGLEALSGPHEAWWLNTFATEADTARVARAYATNRTLSDALGVIAKRKAPLIGTPIEGFAVYRHDLSRGAAWSVAGARFMVVTITRDHRPSDGSVWAMADSTVYVLRPARTRSEAEAFARHGAGRIFAVRPGWSMPAPEWLVADRDFWRDAPAPKPRR
jgi:hypothetical protein